MFGMFNEYPCIINDFSCESWTQKRIKRNKAYEQMFNITGMDNNCI